MLSAGKAKFNSGLPHLRFSGTRKSNADILPRRTSSTLASCHIIEQNNKFDSSCQVKRRKVLQLRQLGRKGLQNHLIPFSTRGRRH
jgi:hypothetical protein